MKKILMILALVFMLTSCGSYVNTTYTDTQNREYYQNYFSSLQTQKIDPVVQTQEIQNVSVSFYVTPNGYFNMDNIYSNYFYGSYYRPIWYSGHYPTWYFSWYNYYPYHYSIYHPHYYYYPHHYHYVPGYRNRIVNTNYTPRTYTPRNYKSTPRIYTPSNPRTNSTPRQNNYSNPSYNTPRTNSIGIRGGGRR